MTQTRLSSFIESVLNTVIGFVIGLGTQILVFPWFGVHIPLHSNVNMALVFTVISIARSYAIRRWFNARLHKFAVKVSGEK